MMDIPSKNTVLNKERWRPEILIEITASELQRRIPDYLKFYINSLTFLVTSCAHNKFSLGLSLNFSTCVQHAIMNQQFLIIAL